MSPTEVLRLPMRAPDDLGGFEAMMDTGRIDPGGILSLWCKTQGNGLRNDFTKPWVELLLRRAVARRLGLEAEALGDRLLVLVSGGSEGVVSPHLVVVQRGRGGDGAATGLVAGLAAGGIPPAIQGSAAHAAATAAQLRLAMDRAGITAPDQVGLVLLRAPADPRRPGHDAAVRGAAALGAALALGEVPEGAVTDAAMAADPALHARRCFVVARHDGPGQQALVVGNAPGGDPRFAIAHAVLRDPLDAPAAAGLLARLGLQAGPQLPPEQSARLVAAIAKGDAPASGLLRGLPHVMAVDNDVAMHRHARAAYGAMLAALVGHPAVLVSGGAERQGPPEGGFAAMICQTDDAKS